MIVALHLSLEEAVLVRAVLRDGWVRHVHPTYLEHATDGWKDVHVGMQRDADAIVAQLEALLP